MDCIYCLFLKELKVLVYTFLFSILFSLGARLQVCIKYALNQNYYAAVLCENKTVENSCCQGKCAVQKELADLDKKEEPQPGKNNNAILKIAKAAEMLPSTYRFCAFRPFTAWVHKPLACGTCDGNPAFLLRPPTPGAFVAVG
jgi:hypothetical protein